MQLDTWYDLAVRGLSELTDPAREKLAEAEDAALPGSLLDDEQLGDEPAEPGKPRPAEPDKNGAR